jgi:LacI family transcriptional regulator
MAAADVPVDESWISLGPPEPARVRGVLNRLLGARPAVTALFTGNNRLTVTVLRELAERPWPAGGGRPALLGFDDFELADVLRPGVSVVAQDPAGLGRHAAELLFARLGGQRTPPRRITLPTRIIARGSGEVPPTS